jgi:hypothetical protein
MARDAIRSPGVMLGALLAGVLAGAVPGRAAAGTCTIIQGGLFSISHVAAAGDVFSRINSANGVGIPVEVDEAAGTITILRENIVPFVFPTPGGDAELLLGGPTVAGTIDAAGHIVVPDFGVNTRFRNIDLPLTITFSSGPKVLESPGGVEHANSGVPLDFTTGEVTLTGNGTIPSAPIVEEPVASEFFLTCRLDPIPNRDALPAGATLKGVKGRAKLGGASGDTLALSAKLKPGQGTIDLANRDALVEILKDDGTTLVRILAHAAALTGKGKRRQAKDADGSLVEPLVGHKGEGTPFKGQLSLVGGKGGVGLKLKVGGLDLSQLAGTVGVQIAIGTTTASRTATVQGTSNSRRLK